ncbi:D-glycero-beta-D-manno-heptose-7-phosphate kinase [Roseomonas sp. SSH11]|uniref:Bifunctional protein HldE n=2 Tax=Pararoseomonas baculiformis TaxID=2820812 RepID=A0ABS4AII9_9PROT|nr:D-glycero-beta-D-manno-heptose-7-phosphate kinase [Pararoseomonas baculiformis]
MNGAAPDTPALPMAAADLAEAVRSLRRASVLVVGDAMLDRTVYGHVNRISPEAPVPVLSVEREVAMPGGAGNVVRNLTALGTSVAFLSVVGDDQAGSDLTGLIGGQPGVEPWLLVQGGRATTTKTRFIASGQQLLRADQEVAQPIHPRLADRLVRIAQDTVAATKVMILSDYRKGVLAGDVPERLIAAAHAAGRRVVVDPKGEDFSLYSGADLLVPNRAELRRATGMSVESEHSLLAAARAMRDRLGIGAVLVTRGRDGMTLLDGDAVHHFPAEAAEVVDVSGAGDTVVAVVAAGLAAGLPLPVAARLSNVAAGLVVGKLGTAVARDTDMLEAMSGEHGTLRKIVSRSRAAELAERWRRRGWRVGFTDGHFDLLRPGHMHLLEQARRWCDRVIVGVQTDAAVRRVKGPARPIQAEAARAAVIASLPSVDLVTFFDEDTAEAAIEAIRPDLLVKGADRRIDEVVGGLMVQEWGGVVRLAELLPERAISAADIGR